MIPITILAISTTSLIVELVAFGLLFLGYSQKRRRRYRQHGIAMIIAVALHLIVILSWMILSFVTFLRAAPLNLGNALQVSALVHVALGAVAVMMGVWLVGSWRLQVDIQKCFARKRLMLATIIVWSGAMLLGILLYAALVTS